MINGFEKETEPLTDEEIRLLPGFSRSLRKRIGKENAITNVQIRKAYEKMGIILPPSRVRKLINHIRVNGLVELLCASSRGYFVASVDEEIVEYMDGLKSRIDAQNLVLENLRRQYTQLCFKLK